MNLLTYSGKFDTFILLNEENSDTYNMISWEIRFAI